jgi:hypothetical protein
MRTPPLTPAICLATLAALAHPALAQDAPEFNVGEYLRQHTNPPVLEGRTNAALEYIKIWSSITGPDLTYFNAYYIWLRDQDTDLNPRSGPVENERAFLARQHDTIDRLISAAALPECHWGLPQAPSRDDVALYFPTYLQWIRSSAWALAADANRCIDEGNAAGAADRIVALIRMSCQNTDDHYLILANCSSQWCRAALDLTQMLFEKGQLTPAAARPIHEAFKSVSKEDPFGVCSSAAGDAQRLLADLHTRYKGPAAGAHFIAEANSYFLDRWDAATIAFNLNQDQFEKQLRGTEAYLAKCASTWCKPDSEVVREELDTEAHEGQFGALTLLVGHPWPGYQHIVMQVQGRVETTMKMLSQVIEQNQTPPPIPEKPKASAHP